MMKDSMLTARICVCVRIDVTIHHDPCQIHVGLLFLNLALVFPESLTI